MTSSDRPGRNVVVVGVDGSPQSLAAVDLAAREAAWRGRPLRVVLGLGQPYRRPGADLPPDGDGALGEDLRQRAERIVDDAVARARNMQPTVDVSGEVLTDSGAQALIRQSHSALLVVIGDRGSGAFTGLLVGSVAIHVASHGTCPVLIARGTTNTALPILLAADGSPASDPAVGFAFEEAALRGAPLLALHVWSHPASRGPGDMQPLVYEEAVVEEEEAEVLRMALAEWKKRYPHVAVHHRVVHGRIRKTIIDATQEAQLIVLGARGHGGFAGLLLGSVSQAVLRHAACPTAIVPHEHGRPGSPPVAR